MLSMEYVVGWTKCEILPVCSENIMSCSHKKRYQTLLYCMQQKSFVVAWEWGYISSRHIVTFYVALLVAFLSPETTLTLRNLASELQEVVDWYRVGLSLGIKSYQLEEIRINRMGDAMHCKLNMLDLWLRGDVDASWSKLVGALAESNHSFIADRIREKYLGIKVKPSKLLSICSVEPLYSNPLNWGHTSIFSTL